MTDDKLSCLWQEDDLGNWETQCGGMFSFIEGKPLDNNFNYYPFYGGALESVELQEDEV